MAGSIGTLAVQPAKNLSASVRTHGRSPVYTEILRQIPPAVKLANANSLFIMARDALYFQEIRRGHSPKEAMKIAAQRLLSLHDR